ncbi:L-2-hydroxyglutarate oxidase [Mycolicibacterium sp. 018/SC-01/001]|uniref:L-2-hydroxyglutarate oxidase n=1 Tax=Mycolicibacterium sp. 018/SC-01/001 TaxID=2592069 RepID=UPI0011804E58|nr:L-2-hydroxyglutarate oxidase [Mycolicibacterium sp. 018/SC-01/001]TRW80950.1 L-2-hydroxyglutarate oxidase [Mycolicibacterium sp. 018/SC-01/001]
MSTTERTDVVIVGGGIVGLATAYKIQQLRPGTAVTVLEKESTVAAHQTGHNSGVIHSGIYYPPGSLKARLCKQGEKETKDFATEHEIPWRATGKLLVATNSVEKKRMTDLFERAQVNGLDVEMLDSVALGEAEPRVRGVGAIRVAATSIVDYALISRALAAAIVSNGGVVQTGRTVTAIREEPHRVIVETEHGTWEANHLVACAGLQADRIAKLAALDIDTQIVPFRGEYYALPASKSDLVNHLIYPIPDPDLPFLGVHLSPTINGELTVGPNAVLGFAREKYPKLSVDLRDVADFARFPGLWKVARKHMRTGVHEMKNSFVKRGYLAECRKYCPDITLDDLLPREAGIRAQAVRRDGTLVHDFLLETTARMIHVLNAPSPAATSALPIGEMLARQLLG